MEDPAETHMQQVVAILASRMRAFRQNREGPGVIFVLGAGCSMQYGLPSFLDLLGGIYRETHISEMPASLTELRERMDLFWRFSEPLRARLVERHLGTMNGEWCRGYRDLAYLARGYLRAIVNMNFDRLLHQALEREGFAVELEPDKWPDPASPTFTLLTPHGNLAGINRRTGKPSGLILDITASDLFINSETERKAKELFAQNDVVVVGYSGGDAKMAQVLRGDAEHARCEDRNGDTGHEKCADRQGKNVFVFNLSPPGAHVLSAVSARNSAELYVTGPAATFERLTAALRRHLDDDYRRLMLRTAGDGSEVRLGGKHASLFNREERAALEQCRLFALRQRSSLNVAEASETAIDEHAHALFQECMDLASRLGCPLTTAERFLVYSAAFLHDLGYFFAYSAGQEPLPGYEILRTHGKLTVDLIRPRLETSAETLKRITPASFCEEDRANFKDLLLTLCEHHSSPHDLLPKRAEKDLVFGFHQVPVRLDLVHKIFVAAEELIQGHPFLPSPYRLDSLAEHLVQDPLLDIYLVKKSRVRFEVRCAPADAVAAVKFEVRRAPADAATMSAPAEDSEILFGSAVGWFCAMAHDALAELQKVVRGILLEKNIQPYISKTLVADDLHGGSCHDINQRLADTMSQVDSSWTSSSSPSPSGSGMSRAKMYKRKVAEALEEALRESIEAARPSGDAGAAPDSSWLSAALDLVVVYTFDYKDRWEGEEVEILERAAQNALATIWDSLPDGVSSVSRHFHAGLLPLYFERKEKDVSRRSPMDAAFLKAFERTYYPAWRLCAEQWRFGNDVVCMARAALDFGSSSRRGEVVEGLEQLILQKIVAHGANEWSYGHNRCMLCTGRLLYILSSALLLFPRGALLEVIGGAAGRKRMDGLITYMLSQEDCEKCWWGLGEGDEIKSADYIAWGLRGLAMAIVADELLPDAWGPGESCLGILRSAVHRLAGTVLGYMASGDLFSKRAEEPRSFILGEVATTYLCLGWLERRLEHAGRKGARLFTGKGARYARHRRVCEAKFEKAFREMKRAGLAQLDTYYALPAWLFLHHLLPKADPERQKLAQEAVLIATECATSRVWLREGAGRGSWGNNLENTQRLASCLSVFWRYVFDHEEEFKNLSWQPQAAGRSSAKGRRRKRATGKTARAVIHP